MENNNCNPDIKDLRIDMQEYAKHLEIENKKRRALL